MCPACCGGVDRGGEEVQVRQVGQRRGRGRCPWQGRCAAAGAMAMLAAISRPAAAAISRRLMVSPSCPGLRPRCWSRPFRRRRTAARRSPRWPSGTPRWARCRRVLRRASGSSSGAGAAGQDGAGIIRVEQHRPGAVPHVTLRAPPRGQRSRDAVMDEQPPLSHAQRRRTGTDLDRLVVILGQGDEPVRPDMGERSHVLEHRVGRRVGDPDSRSRVTQAGRQEDVAAAGDRAEVPRRAMQHGVREPAVRARDRLGEVHDILVREQVQIDVQVRLVLEVHRAQTPPAAQVVGHGHGRPRARAARRPHNS